ncbi:class I adenylate-forming enzyme family protein [Novosphingobium album (ex Liu et al. 2023)]|uniref:Class I adenylate-forming enzyme family protein n=1 Tax=Novosphingobium album (ex Liu et al. 2023) TaxID=3031130 RepID=A0ABT5WQT0_9SPHN|nr:class I adenylate-forming enzyme family protein [Novosphingobium album (ex Liu et al. 2023)]MDE8652402.1 class I adenylate-forming enzyme family protein [Novosphingobium album (ex Liu et al. 2023)]
MTDGTTDPGLALVRGDPLESETVLGALTLPGFLREVTARYADREALVMYQAGAGTERWSYAELWRRSMAVARALVACGVGKDSRVGILMTNRLEWVSACFGITLAGGTVVGLSTFATPDELEYLLRASAVSIVLYEPHVLAKDFTAILTDLEPGIASAAPGRLASLRFPFLRRLVAVGAAPGGAIEAWDAFLAHGDTVGEDIVAARAEAVKPADPALLFFSSGSTGKPKGILNGHRGVNIQSWRWTRIYDFFNDPHPVRTWSANGLFWSGNFSIALGGTLAAGGTLILQRTFRPAETVALMAAERVTFPYCWPHQWAQLEAEPAWPEADLSAFHYFDAEINLRRPQRTITTTWTDPRATYGSTETFTISTAYPVSAPREVWEGCNGGVLPGNTVRIVDPASGETLRRGETGEIAVKGPTLMLGYIGIPSDEALDAEGFYRAGDGGYLDERGRLVFQGRINDIIKTGGANVSPVEVDWTLCSCPGVKVCKTTGVPHETLGEIVVSCIVREEGRTLTEAEVIAWLKARLASYKVPRKVLFVEPGELDLTNTAKIKPAEARALAMRKLAAA